MMNKLTLLVRDEEGMTLVELLAVIVILSIVAAIGGVAIAGVIQRSREDARVADIQMLFEAATLAESSDSFISKGGGGTAGTAVTATQLHSKGYATSIAFLKNLSGTSTGDKAKFTLKASTATDAAKLQLSLDGDATFAGSKGNVALTDLSTQQVKELTRTELFNATTP